ncbi:hypothetical protein ACSFC1_04590 [Pseudothermotoga sp. U03pept]|uniref:hypothetical protein n=1 Tax=Pseudothermotoga sp. U03pept TaxID=3447012 RepID=UPI003F09D9CB
MKQGVLVVALIAVVALLMLIVSFKTPKAVVLILEDGQAEFREGVEKYAQQNNLKVDFVTVRIDQDTEQIDKILRRYSGSYAIGPRLSSEALALIPHLEKYQIFSIAPLVTSPKVVGKSRYLMTLSVSDTVQARQLAERILNDSNREIFVVCDKGNLVYTETFFQIMKETVALDLECRYIDSVDELLDLDFSIYDSIVLIVDGRVAGMIAQVARKKGFNGKIYGSDYVYTDALITTGSWAVEGISIYGLFDLPQMMNYGYTELGPAGGYDALMVVWNLISAKVKTNEAYDYLQGKTFKGASGTFTVRDDLSVERLTNFVTIRNGKFVVDEVKR